MSYQVHNFQTGDVIEAFPVNEMDAQIQLNETNIAQKIDISKKGAANGVAELDSSGKVPTSQLPSYVDDVLEYDSRSDFPATGESGKIYVAKDTNLTYRWNGSAYVEISPSLALGETSATAYRGDRGKTAYDHATESGKISVAASTNLYKISVTGQGHIGSVTPAEKADLVGLGVLDGNQGAANAGKFMKVGADGSLAPSDVDMSAKADKPSNPTNGDLAALDANGNLVDSGKKTSDFVPVTREINGHALSADFNISKSDVGLGNVDNTSDANKPVSTAQQTALNGKTDKVSGATDGNFAGLDANGNLTDSGKKASDFLEVNTIDDLAGIGDTDFVWSADKIQEELNTKADVIGIVDATAEAVKTIPDGANGALVALTVGIEPVQDLHGYDNPWPAGGSRNIYSGTQTVTKDASAIYVEVALPVPIPAGTYTMTAAVTLASGVSAARASFRKSDKTAITYIQSLDARAPNRSGGEVTLSEDCYYIYFYGTTSTSTKSSATFADIQIETGSATDYVPYSNICPISGWTGCNVTRTGKNLFDYAQTPYSANSNINSSGEIGSNNNYDVYKLVLPAGNYFASEITTATANNQSIRIATYTKTGEMIDYYEQSRDGAGVMAKAFSVGDTAAYVLVMIRKNCQNPYVAMGESETEYETYAGEEYAITFPSSAGTVYGGTLTVNKDGTGKLVANLKKVILNGTEDWRITSNALYAGIDGDYLKETTAKGACDSYDFVGGISGAAGLTKNISVGMYTGSSYNRIYIRDDQYADATAFKAALSTNNVTVCYELATPVEIDLTELEVIETLKGINNIFADTGDILSVDHSADTKMYVNEVGEDKQEQIDLIRDMIAESDESTATEIHDIGELFICNNKLYRATAAIAVGESIIEGSNVAETSISEQLSNTPEMIHHAQIGKNGTIVLTMGVYSRAVVFVLGSNTQRVGIISILGGSSEAYTYNLIQALTNITVTVSGMTVTLTNNAAGTEFLDVMKLYGNITITT